MKIKRIVRAAGRYGIKPAIILLLAAGLCSVLQVRVHAEQDISMSINGGFDGRCRLGELNAVNVSLEAEGAGAKGVLKLDAGGRLYRQAVEITADSEKQLVFSIPFFDAADKISAVFENGGEAFAKADFIPEILPENSVLIGILSDTPESFRYVEAIDLSAFGGKKTYGAALDKNLGYTLEQLDCFNFMLLDNFDMANVPEKNRRTLLNWISKGNCILIGAGAYAYKNMKCEFEHLSGPLNIGGGTAVPVKEGLENAAPELVQDLLGKYLSPYGISRLAETSGLSRRIKESEKLYPAVDENLKPAKKLFFFLVSLLALYLLGTGAGLYADKKLKGLFYGVVVGFCALFYIISLPEGIQDTPAARVEVRIHGNETETYTLTGAYPGKGAETILELSDASFVYGCGEDRQADIPLERAAAFKGRGPYYAYGSNFIAGDGLSMKLKLEEGDILTGKVKNPLPYPMEQCLLIVGDTAISLGALEGREEIGIAYRLDHNLKNMGDYNFLEAISGTNRLDGWKRQLFEYYYYNLENNAAEGKLIGFGNERSRVRINGRERKVNSAVLHVFGVEVETGGSQVFLPWDYIKPAAVLGEGLETMGRKECLVSRGKDIGIYYILPQNFNPEEIRFNYKAETGTELLEFFDRENASWHKPEGGVLSGEPLYCATAGGPLLVRIKGGARVILPRISVKGKNTAN